MDRVGDGDVAGKHPLVAGHHLFAQGDDDPIVVDFYVHASADGLGMHRIVVGLMAYPAIRWEPQVLMPVHLGQHWGKRRHRLQVLVDALRGGT
jgi:hypothetical protein